MKEVIKVSTKKQKWAMWRNSTLWSLKGAMGNLVKFEDTSEFPRDVRAKMDLSIDFLREAISALEKLNTYEKFQKALKGE